MTKLEMQKFLLEMKDKGISKAEALEMLARILGLSYGDEKEDSPTDTND